MYTPTQQFAGAIPDLDDDLTLHCPHPDDSQRQAISWALNGHRLEGPGTEDYKQSQTLLLLALLIKRKFFL